MSPSWQEGSSLTYQFQKTPEILGLDWWTEFPTIKFEAEWPPCPSSRWLHWKGACTSKRSVSYDGGGIEGKRDSPAGKKNWVQYGPTEANPRSPQGQVLLAAKRQVAPDGQPRWHHCPLPTQSHGTYIRNETDNVPAKSILASCLNPSRESPSSLLRDSPPQPVNFTGANKRVFILSSKRSLVRDVFQWLLLISTWFLPGTNKNEYVSHKIHHISQQHVLLGKLKYSDQPDLRGTEPTISNNQFSHLNLGVYPQTD